EFPSGPADRAPSALRATPPASWGRNPKRPVGRLPRGAAAKRGSTAGGREGARAKRARRPQRRPGGRYGPRPLHFADRYIAEEAKPRTSPPAGGRGKVPPAERSEAEG